MKKYNIKKFLVILCGFVVIGTSSCGKKVDNSNQVYEEQDQNNDIIDKSENNTKKDYGIKNEENESVENDIDQVSDLIEEELSDEEINTKEILIQKLITIIDFVFYGTEIGGLTFDQITDGTKQNIIDTFYMIDETLEYYYPGYKNNLSIKYQNAITEIKRLYLKTEVKINNNLTEEEKNQIDYGVSKAKEYVNIVEDEASNIYNHNKIKVKNWYEKFRSEQ